MAHAADGGLARTGYNECAWRQLAAAGSAVACPSAQVVVVAHAAPQHHDWPRPIALRADVFVETDDADSVVLQVHGIVGACADHVLHVAQDLPLGQFQSLGYRWCWSRELVVKMLSAPAALPAHARPVTVSVRQVPGGNAAIYRFEAREAGAYRGQVDLVLARGATASLSGLEVEAAHRGRGIGALLVDCAERHARAALCARIVLHPSETVSVRDFYGSKGYVPLEEVKVLLSPQGGAVPPIEKETS